MKNYLKTYQIHLKTVGPVFIGSGEILRKSQWILNFRNKTATIIDPRKFFDFLSKEDRLLQYEEYIMQIKPEPLFKWIEHQKFSDVQIRQFTAYTLDTTGFDTKNQRVNDMQLCMKDPYGNPYIPGSSLKGALRTALLAKKIKEQGYSSSSIIEEIRDYRGNPKRFLQRESQELKSAMFHTKGRTERKSDMVNDMMSGIRISDSNAVSTEFLTLCQKLDENIDSRISDLPLIRECIKPNVEFQFELSIDETETDITKDYIADAINEFLADYNRMFLSHFKSEVLYSENILYLGGGVGFPAKTVLNRLLDTNPHRVDLVAKTIDNTLPMKMKRHHKDKHLGVSPSVVKLTETEGEYYQMGPCRIEFV